MKWVLVTFILLGVLFGFYIMFQSNHYSDEEIRVLMSEAKPAESEVYVYRFLGLEIYKISDPHWNLYYDQDDKKYTLHFSFHSEEAIKQFEDTEYVGQYLSWELNILNVATDKEEIFVGKTIPAPDYTDEDGWLVNFYYGSHDGSEDNTIEILDREENRVRALIMGRVVDLNYYDGSKPRAGILVDTWFDFDPTAKRSMQ